MSELWRLARSMGLSVDTPAARLALEQMGLEKLRSLDRIMVGRTFTLDDIAALFSEEEEGGRTFTIELQEDEMPTVTIRRPRSHGLRPEDRAALREGTEAAREMIKMLEQERKEEARALAEAEQEFCRMLGLSQADPEPEPRTYANEEDAQYAGFCRMLGIPENQED